MGWLLHVFFWLMCICCFQERTDAVLGWKFWLYSISETCQLLYWKNFLSEGEQERVWQQEITFVPYCNAGIIKDMGAIEKRLPETESGNNPGLAWSFLRSWKANGKYSLPVISLTILYSPLWNQINNYRLIKCICKLPLSEFNLEHDSILRWQHPVKKNKNQWLWPFWPLLRTLPGCILHFKFYFPIRLIF